MSGEMDTLQTYVSIIVVAANILHLFQIQKMINLKYRIVHLI